MNKYWLLSFLVFSIIGLISSSIILYTFYYLHISPLFCTNTPLVPGITIDCLKVLSSGYSKIFNFPLDSLALIWFIIDITFVILYNYFKFNIRFLFFWRFLGLLFVPYLIYTELFLLNSICLYCTIMQSMIILNFATILIYFYKNNLKIVKI